MGVSGRGGGDTGQAYHGSYGHHGQFGEFVLQQYQPSAHMWQQGLL